MKKKNDKKVVKGLFEITVKTTSDNLVSDIRKMIDETRSAVAVTVNAGLTILYWRIGKRIKEEVLKSKRAEYGEEILPTLSAKLTSIYGEGFKERNLARMIKFAECFPDKKIVATLSQQLSWSHFVEIFPVKDSLAREFYAEMCRFEHWSVRTLRQKINGMLFERTAIAKKPEHIIEHEIKTLRETDKLTPDLIFRDPYFLDFLGLKGSF